MSAEGDRQGQDRCWRRGAVRHAARACSRAWLRRASTRCSTGSTRAWSTGSILARLPDGTHPPARRPRARVSTAMVNLNDWRALVRLATSGSIGWYQAWEAGEWDSPDPVPLFALFMANGETLGDTGRASGPFRLRRALRALAQPQHPCGRAAQHPRALRPRQRLLRRLARADDDAIRARSSNRRPNRCAASR